MDFGEEINQQSEAFPKKELYNLSSQICRAPDSIALNNFEGSILQSAAEFRKFLGYAICSLGEVLTCLYKANRRTYINDEKFINLNNQIFNLMNQIVAFRNQLK